MGQATRARHECRVLVVEDDSTQRFVFAELLRDEGYTVIEAADGADAIAVLEQGPEAVPIRLVVLDMNLPRLDGLAVLQHIAEWHRFVPVVAMSAVATTLTAARARAASEAILKPFELERFLDVVARNCAGSQR